MRPEEAGQFVVAGVAVQREDIARAKTWILQKTGITMMVAGTHRASTLTPDGEKL